MDQIKPLFTATATAIGGRNGHTETSDGVVKADLSVPKAMGGPGRPDTATPEHLFAACFGGALDFVAKQQQKDATNAKVTCAASIGPREGGGFGLAVKLTIEDKSLAQAKVARSLGTRMRRSVPTRTRRAATSTSGSRSRALRTTG
jgi:Ohr subfamily peroxiredoxin